MRLRHVCQLKVNLRISLGRMGGCSDCFFSLFCLVLFWLRENDPLLLMLMPVLLVVLL